ncbi:DUF1254 domain-containing protein [Streptomyces sp. NPDC050743]|uniref:DUF1254 domain-containing protein n=1 Tax=Streptomyces sp. NPDC050743 TaxID=3365634 RepID=UPI0037B4489B
MDPATIRQTTTEAWIWGFAMLENYRRLYQQALDDADPRYVGGFGVFRHYPQPFTPANTDIVTPNNDTPYSWAWLDLRAEPWVIEVPAMDRYYVIPPHDLDTTYVGFIGSRATGPHAGRYLVAGPGWKDPVPDGFERVLRADTNLVGILGRTYLAGPEDVPNLKRLQAQYVLKPLSAHLGIQPPAPEPEPAWPVWRDEVVDSLEFFTFLDFLLGFFPVLPADADLRTRLAELGIGGGNFEPATLPPEVRDSLEQGIVDGRAQLTEKAAATTSSAGLFGTRAQLAGKPFARALGAVLGIYGLPEEEAWYGRWRVDDQGNPLDGGSHEYTVRFPPGQLPPARFFWSATAYRLPEILLIDNPIDRYSIGDRTPGLVYDPDGGLTLRIQHQRPRDPEQAANWLPAPDGPFVVVIRLYGPDPAVPEGRWQLPSFMPTS